MLSSISPLGERGRRQRFAVTATSYIVASTLAGAGLGATLGAIGAVALGEPGALAMIGFAAAALLGLVADLGLFGWRVPGPRRQVDEDWLARYRGWLYGAGFGLQLGFGFATIVTSSATYAAFAAAGLSAHAGAGAIIGATFGLVRSLPILTTIRVRDWTQLRAQLGTRQLRLPAVRRTAAAAQLAIAAGAVLGAFGWASA